MAGPKKNVPATTAVGKGTLVEKVEQALVRILDEEDSPASARASAARTLMEFFGTTDRVATPADSASIAELDDEIAALLQRKAKGE